MPLAVGGDTATPLNRSLRLSLMLQHIAAHDFVLDVGCGRGEYLLELLTHTPNALGIDTAAKKLQECWKLHPQLRSRALLVSAEDMPFAPEKFDIVIVNEVLEHVPDQDGALREIWRVLRPGGKLLLFCPNRLFPFETHGLQVRGTLRMWLPLVHYLAESLRRRLAIEAVARNYWPRSAARLLATHGFQVQHINFVPQTFENISGSQPALIRTIRPLLRRGVTAAANIPGVRALVSVSTFLIATKNLLHPRNTKRPKISLRPFSATANH